MNSRSIIPIALFAFVTIDVRAAQTQTAESSKSVASHLASSSSESAVGSLNLSPYEQETLEIVLSQRHLEIEPVPEGKLLEGVDVVPLDVFEKRDPAPGFLNWFHYTTRPKIIEREILMKRQQPWVSWRVAETARRLRTLRQLSLVLVVPVKGSDGEHVRALVVTKDVWSLRLNTSITYKNGKLEYLLLQPSEENVAGTHLRIAGLYVYDVLSNSFGAVASHQCSRHAFEFPRVNECRRRAKHG